MKAKSQPNPHHTEESYAGLSAMCKRLSKGQNFKTLGDELGAPNSVMVMSGLKAAGEPIERPEPPAGNAKTDTQPAKRKVRVIRDGNGAITGFERE